MRVNLFNINLDSENLAHGELYRSARPLRSLAERRSGVLPTSVHLRWRSAELPLESIKKYNVQSI